VVKDSTLESIGRYSNIDRLTPLSKPTGHPLLVKLVDGRSYEARRVRARRRSDSTSSGIRHGISRLVTFKHEICTCILSPWAVYELLVYKDQVSYAFDEIHSLSSLRLLYSYIPELLHPRRTHCCRGKLDLFSRDTWNWQINVKFSTIVSQVSADRVVGLLWRSRRTLRIGLGLTFTHYPMACPVLQEVSKTNTSAEVPDLPLEPELTAFWHSLLQYEDLSSGGHFPEHWSNPDRLVPSMPQPSAAQT
jgi:hypothetical protein